MTTQPSSSTVRAPPRASSHQARASGGSSQSPDRWPRRACWPWGRQRLAAVAHGGLYLLVLCQVATGAIGSYLWAPARVLHGYVWDAVLILAHVLNSAKSMSREDIRDAFAAV